MSAAAPALWNHRGGDVPARPDAACRLAGRLPGDPGAERAGGGADEATQTRQRGDTRLFLHRTSKSVFC